ncbi:helix-turn-helix transcriptional regulator [Mycolicibacterium brisbanense]|uniref:Helix-turn-helix domain-containing protein n=1 Tax=Mycolicibacterium brisbanense TaxID=146020 RepID=A0A100VZK0_9MYCO|nr:helix-turn-helix domain-containing protein [Mycolicibacterium brisbanense]MCV7156131.1 helix-turn-helix domain-containing protein [Mycolicibacterium brisbanense]GAS88888.1 uncharacterized protein RMCB_2984 [Mycolicibacterium brisbanense]
MAQIVDELLTIHEAAAMLNVTVGHMYNLRWRSHGPLSYKRGKRIVYRRSDVDSYLAREREATLKGERL